MRRRRPDAPGPAPRSLGVEGVAGRFPVARADLFLGNAGTAVRPLTAALAIIGGDYRIRGVPRMHERPIRDLVEPLRALGCTLDYAGKDGYPPLAIGPSHARAGSPSRAPREQRNQRCRGFLAPTVVTGP